MWQPIETAPRDGETIITLVVQATVPLVRSAHWDDGENWDAAGFDNQDEARGWWSYDNCVGQTKLVELHAPTHWMPLPQPPESN